MSDYAIRTTRLRREFPVRKADPRVALDDLGLEIPAGEVHGLLGPNGAGKTTLCKILSTVLLPTSGQAFVAGHDVVAEAAMVRPRIGIVLGGERGLYTRLTARQNLRYWAAMYGRGGRAGQLLADRLLDRVGLLERADERVETYSRGMKQRVHLARGLVGDPAVLILDEPTTGMDPVAAREFRLLVDELRAERRTILLTTHDMAEAEAVCDRVSLIDAGRLLGTADPRTIGGWLSAFEHVDVTDAPASVLDQVGRLPGVAGVSQLGAGRHRIETDQAGATRQVLSVLVSAGVTRVTTGTPTLEDVYLKLIGERGLLV